LNTESSNTENVSGKHCDEVHKNCKFCGDFATNRCDSFHEKCMKDDRLLELLRIETNRKVICGKPTD
jgi:hypothetical protein